MKKISIILLVLFCSATQSMNNETANELARKAKKQHIMCPYRCASYQYQKHHRNDPAIWRLCKEKCYQEYQETMDAIIKAQSQHK